MNIIEACAGHRGTAIRFYALREAWKGARGLFV
jgi:hypothetical protein